jgi:hypothetical protein
LGSGGSMVARLKLKGIDGRAPPGVSMLSASKSERKLAASASRTVSCEVWELRDTIELRGSP